MLMQLGKHDRDRRGFHGSKVKRDGEMVIIPVAELVPGDVRLGLLMPGDQGSKPYNLPQN